MVKKRKKIIGVGSLILIHRPDAVYTCKIVKIEKPKINGVAFDYMVVGGTENSNTRTNLSLAGGCKRKKENNMLANYKAENFNDPDGMPYGGYAKGVGIDIKWQEGSLGRGAERKEPNGAFVETIIDIARQRIQYYQNSKFNCRENAIAITKLEEALMWLNKRTQDREKRQVEGTHIQ